MALAVSADHIIASMFISSAVLASITLLNPILFFIAAFAFMFASGLGSYIGLLIGKNKIDEANKINSFIVIALTPIVRIVLPYILDNKDTIDIAFRIYLGIGFAGVVSNIGIQSTIFFTAINRPIESLVISVIRTLFLIPIFSFTMIAKFKLQGIMFGFLIPEIIITIIFIYYFKKLDLCKLSDESI